jgi:hypothetical protein
MIYFLSLNRYIETNGLHKNNIIKQIPSHIGSSCVGVSSNVGSPHINIKIINQLKNNKIPKMLDNVFISFCFCLYKCITIILNNQIYLLKFCEKLPTAFPENLLLGMYDNENPVTNFRNRRFYNLVNPSNKSGWGFTPSQILDKKKPPLSEWSVSRGTNLINFVVNTIQTNLSNVF